MSSGSSSRHSAAVTWWSWTISAATRARRSAKPSKLILLPKYSPDLNPVEQVLATLKHLLRKAAARTRDEVYSAIGTLLGTYTAEECANYLRNSGYSQT